MKKVIYLVVACLLLNACASPPQPYGSRIPVNLKHDAFSIEQHQGDPVNNELSNQ